jgi:heme-degrading monooxygenase HmoA
MFVIISHLPPLKAGQEAEFLAWFAAAKAQLSGTPGLVGWRLLKPLAGGSYTVLVEHESQETFLAMRNSPVHAEVGHRLAPLLVGPPSPQLFEVVIG